MRIRGSGELSRDPTCSGGGDVTPLAITSGSNRKAMVEFELAGPGLDGLIFKGGFEPRFTYDSPFGTWNRNLLIGTLGGSGFDREILVSRVSTGMYGGRQP